MNRNVTKADFFKLWFFPNVIGAVDGTHVRIQAPHEDEASFVNRKGYYSIKVQAVCNAQEKFTCINAAWPGCSHDAHIFRTSQVCTYLEGIQNPPEHGILLDDSGYPCRPFLMTPYTNATTDSQMRYSRHHATTGCVIERTFWEVEKKISYSSLRGSGAERKMFLVKMCLGNIFTIPVPKKYKRPPCKQCLNDSCTLHSDFFDSVVAQFEGKAREFVVFDRAQCYPEYIITYQ